VFEHLPVCTALYHRAIVTVLQRIFAPPVDDELVDADFPVTSDEVVEGVIRAGWMVR
jgi:hypothetical protein